MKCNKHTKRAAVAVCVSCGVGVCRDCEIRVSGRSHCKQCVEEGKATPTEQVVQPSAPRAPMVTPAGQPRRGYFVLGAIGLVIFIIAATLSWTFSYLLLFLFLWYSPFFYIISLVPNILLTVGGIMSAIGFYGQRRNFGSNMGLATFIISLVFIWFQLIPGIIRAALYGGYYYYYPWYMISYTLFYVGYALMGVMVILWGCSMLVNRIQMGNQGLAIAAGVLFIITGGFICSIVLEWIGLILVIPSGILGIILFATVKVPT